MSTAGNTDSRTFGRLLVAERRRDEALDELRVLRARAKRHGDEVARLRARVISVAAGGVTICERCLSNVESTNLRAMLKDKDCEIAQLRALLAAGGVEQRQPVRLLVE